MKLHPSITPNRVMESVTRRRVSLDNPGFCIACGHEQGGCEGDARKHKCESCGAKAVYGDEELLIELC